MIQTIIDWCQAVVTAADVQGEDVLEVGASDVNGSFRPYLESLGTASYIGTDLEWGRRVDDIVRAEDLVVKYGFERFGVVVSTEMLEHAEAWQECIWNMMAVTKPGGLNLITTRSPGFGYHPYPDDWWRFTMDDFREIWKDWEILSLEPDKPPYPGVFIKARRPADWDALADRERIAAMTVYAQEKP